MTAVKAGDRVRCVLGESVLVGTVSAASGHINIYIAPDGAPRSAALLKVAEDWQVTVLPPPEPSWANNTDALCQFGSGDIWIRRFNGWFHAGCDLGFDFPSHRRQSFPEMCARYDTAPVCLYDPETEKA